VRGLTSTGAFTAWATLLITLISVGILAVFTIGYVKKMDSEAERRNVERQRQICGIIVLIDDRNLAMPQPVDPATARFRQELHAYRVGLGC
jgi:hypothetical protein